jgi:ParB-like nuclease domain
MKKTAEFKVADVPAGAGYERIKIDKLRLDARNPRLAEIGITSAATQFDLLKALWDEMAVEEVAMSIAYSGYFDHEPLFVEAAANGTYTVIEGNRRFAAVKLLVDADARKRVKATKLPIITKERADSLATLPVIITTRKDSWRYLGFKHVNGPATWGSYSRRSISPMFTTTMTFHWRKSHCRSGTTIPRCCACIAA